MSLPAFIVRRVLWTIPVLLLVILFTFLLIRAISTGPFSPENVPPAVQSRLHLDKPWYEQYAFYVKSVFTLGGEPSQISRGRTGNDIIAEQYPNSLLLGLLALTWAVAIGIPAGLIAALRPRSLLDFTVMTLSTVGFGLPNFFVATLLIYYFSVKLGWFPTSGWPDEHWTLDRSVVLPSLTLSLVPMAWFARLMRGGMLETMGQDYVLAARAKGLRSKQIIFRHVLKNSLFPLITAAGPIIGYLITGTLVVEWIFSIPGIGRYFITAVFGRDWFVVFDITILLSVTIIVANLLVDLAYFVLDPRIRDARG
jgi:oligopeptide transport system permease protein